MRLEVYGFPFFFQDLLIVGGLISSCLIVLLVSCDSIVLCARNAQEPESYKTDQTLR